MNFSSSAILAKCETMADHSVRIRIETPELTPESYSNLFSLANKEGWFLFSERPLKPEEIIIPKELPSIRSMKSPAERLRAVIYRYWEAVKSSQDFESFYQMRIEKFIDAVKEKLPPLT